MAYKIYYDFFISLHNYTFFVGVTISVVITRTGVVKSTRKVVVPNNEVAAAYFTS